MAAVCRKMHFRLGHVAFSERQTAAAVVVELPRWARNVARTSFPKSGSNGQHALSSRRECDYDNAGGFDCHRCAATFGSQRNRAMATVGRGMHFRRDNIAFSQTASGGGGRRQSATLGVRRRTEVILTIRLRRTTCALATARVRF